MCQWPHREERFKPGSLEKSFCVWPIDMYILTVRERERERAREVENSEACGVKYSWKSEWDSEGIPEEEARRTQAEGSGRGLMADQKL